MAEHADPITYSRASRARVAFALACKNLSNYARGAVPTNSDRHVRPGEFVEMAARVVSDAQHALQLAAVLERERGTSWEDIGDALEISKQAAHGRFAGAHERWRQQLAEPWAPDRGELGAEDPATWTRRLDEWVIRHREHTDPDPGEHPVSGNLREASLAEQIDMALAEVRALQERERDSTATPSQRRAWFQRKAELFERLAATEPREPAYAEAAANARRQLEDVAAAMSPTEARTGGSPANHHEEH